MLLLIFLFAVAQVIAQIPCTDNDYTASYTQCVGNSRNLIYYWKSGINCSGGVSLPQNIFNLPCDIACGEGYYLPLGARNCSMCEPGTFSIGGGIRVTDWNNWDQQLIYTTFCNDYQGKKINSSLCTGWVVGGGGVYVSSGNITDNQQSVLQVPALLVTDGHIHFEYRVDSEPNYDVLYFRINDRPIFTAKANADFTSFQQDLPKGFYVFTWIYDKDPSVSEGEDAAFLKFLEIGGLDYAQSECTPCARGYYNPLYKQEDCQPCPEDFYQDQVGKTVCNPCDSTEYAFPGSETCTPRPACTTNDYRWEYTDCREPGVRDKRYTWINPIICDTANYQLPSDELGIDCGSCNPGEYRSASTYQCTSCAPGYFNNGEGTRCSPCSAGTIASRGYTFRKWDYIPDSMTTGCRGTCGTNGWRALGNYIDSGFGHGAFAESFLELNISLANTTGYVSFNFTLQCSQPCTLDFADVGYRTETYYFANNRVQNIKLVPDMDDPDEDGGLFHTLRWTFRNQDPRGEGRSDRAIINWISVTNTIGGGASSCSSCNAGTYSTSISDRCIKCGVGTSSPQGSGTCSNCPANYFNDIEGGICIACGHGTTSQPGAVNCTYDCTYTVTTQEGSYEYDLSSLKRTDEMYGPVYDNNRMQYFINICSKEHHNHTCYTPSGNSIQSFACQITTQGYGVDIGRVIGFYELPNNPDGGIIINLSHGLKGCSNQVERSSNITFFCDPSAGIGQPVPGRNGVEKPPCSYNFEWNSTYGCPLCTSRDYDYTFTECVNGRQTKVYFWRENPKRCHDGVSLPVAEYSCQVTTLSCPPGQYALPGTNNCSDCAPGFYSTGTGIEYVDWTTMPAGFTTSLVENALGPWVPIGNSIDSDPIYTSVLTTTKTFVTTGKTFKISHDMIGSVTFWFKSIPYIEYGTECYLSFFIDNAEVIRVVTLQLDYRNATVADLQPGTHTFTWKFTQNNRNSFTDNYHPYASISKIQFNGTASTFCSSCAPGSAASGFGASTCQTCPANTFSLGGSPSCTRCDSGSFSIEGSTHCQPLRNCTSDDYQKFFTNCTSSNTRSSYYVPLDPFFCIGNEQPENQTGLTCAPCPTGSVRSDGGSCSICTPGYFYSSEGNCEPATPGYWAQNIQEYFFDDTISSWPEGFHTNEGWRLRGNYIDSGDHTYNSDNAYDSHLIYHTQFITQGTIRFEYSTPTSSDPEIKLEFYIDGYPIGLGNNGVTEVQVSSGRHIFVWNLHMPPNHRGIATLRRIRVTSTTTGIPIESPCPAGYFSSQAGATVCGPCDPGFFSTGRASTCSPCAAGSYAADVASAECLQCGAGTYTTSQGAAECVTNCSFSFNIGQDLITYNISDVGTATLGPITSSYGDYFIHLCGNNILADACKLNGVEMQSSICFVDNNNNPHNNGKALSFTAHSDLDLVKKGFYLEYQHGELCNPNLPGTPERETRIQFICDTSGNDLPSLAPFVTNTSLCNAIFEWRTIYGCPVCKEEDYSEFIGECVKSKRTVVKNRVSQCNGPIQLVLPDQSCSEGVSVPVGIIVGAVAVFILVSLVAFLIFVRNRKIQIQYQKLQESISAKVVELDTHE